MICLNCDNEEFFTEERDILQKFKNELLEVTTPVKVCSKCGWYTIGLTQLDELRKRTADVYRKNHGLLTGNEIKSIRSKLNLSLCHFASRLKTTYTKAKRWETWLVQSVEEDKLIRQLV